MCPVPKPVQQPLDQEANSLSIAPVEVTTTLDTSVDATNLIQNIVSTPCTEDIIGALKIGIDGRYLELYKSFTSFVFLEYLLTGKL